MSKTTFTTIVTDSCRTATLRRVFVTFPHVAPLGADWNSDHNGREFELASFKGGPVEVYVKSVNGNMVHQGTVRDYAPGMDLRNALKAAWVSAQPSKAALASFEASAADRV